MVAELGGRMLIAARGREISGCVEIVVDGRPERLDRSMLLVGKAIVLSRLSRERLGIGLGLGGCGVANVREDRIVV